MSDSQPSATGARDGDPTAAAARTETAEQDTGRMEQPSPNAIDMGRYFPAYVTFIANKWSRSASRLYRREFGIGMVEWRLLVLLAAEPWATAARADEQIGMDKAAVSRSVRVLEEKGLLRTRPGRRDPRRREFALTAAGHDLHDRIASLALERERRLLSCLQPAEVDQLLGLLDRVHGNLAAVDAASGTGDSAAED